MKSSPKINAWASPSGLGCSTYSKLMPILDPFPNSDLKFGYNDIIGRMETFNRHMQNLHTAIASLREAATPLLNKSKCE